MYKTFPVQSCQLQCSFHWDPSLIGPEIYKIQKKVVFIKFCLRNRNDTCEHYRYDLGFS